jgi:hypothetical protein
VLQRVQRNLPAVPRFQRRLNRAKGGTVRAQGAGVGNHRLFHRIRYKITNIADAEPERNNATEIPVLLAPIPFHLGRPFANAVPLSLSHRSYTTTWDTIGRPTSRLWLSNKGTPLPDHSICPRLVRLARARFGHQINPHLFCDCAATSIAENDPEHVLITKEILGHSTLRTSERYYNHARSQQAIMIYQAHVLAQRRRIPRGPDSVGSEK